MAKIRFSLRRVIYGVTFAGIVSGAMVGVPQSFFAPFVAPELFFVVALALILAVVYEVDCLMNS
jgi:hypothetical protein